MQARNMQWHEVFYPNLGSPGGVLSVQVLQEFYVTMTRKALHPLPSNKVRNIIQDYFSWHIEVNDPLSVLVASRIEGITRFHFGMLLS